MLPMGPTGGGYGSNSSSFLNQSMTGMGNTVNAMFGGAQQSAAMASQCMANSAQATDGLGALAGLSPEALAANDTAGGDSDQSGLVSNLLNYGDANGPPVGSPTGMGAMPSPTGFINQIAGLNTGADGLSPTGLGGGLS